MWNRFPALLELLVKDSYHMPPPSALTLDDWIDASRWDALAAQVLQAMGPGCSFGWSHGRWVAALVWNSIVYRHRWESVMGQLNVEGVLTGISQGNPRLCFPQVYKTMNPHSTLLPHEPLKAWQMDHKVATGEILHGVWFPVECKSFDSVDGQEACVACCNKARNAIAFPCRHRVLCISCARQHVLQSPTCAVCRQRVDHYEWHYS